MTCRIWAETIAADLADTGETNYHVRQDSTRTCRVIHDGPDPQPHLERYAEHLRGLGYRTEIQECTGIQPLRLKITRTTYHH